MIPDGDAACFIDGDMMFTTSDYGNILHDYVNAYPNAILTCWTNRTHSLSTGQQHPLMKNIDVKDVLSFAQSIKNDRTVTRIDGVASMLLMVIPKTIWEKNKFVESNQYRPSENNILGVDSSFVNQIRSKGIQLLRMNGLFMYHQYRLLDGSKSHLI